MTTFALWLLMNVSIAADWGQTRYNAQHPQEYCETGPAKMFIGSSPHRGRVDAYFIGSLLVNNGIMVALPKKYRPYYAGTVTVVETYFVIQNDQIGLKVKF